MPRNCTGDTPYLFHCQCTAVLYWPVRSGSAFVQSLRTERQKARRTDRSGSDSAVPQHTVLSYSAAGSSDRVDTDPLHCPKRHGLCSASAISSVVDSDDLLLPCMIGDSDLSLQMTTQSPSIPQPLKPSAPTAAPAPTTAVATAVNVTGSGSGGAAVSAAVGTATSNDVLSFWFKGDPSSADYKFQLSLWFRNGIPSLTQCTDTALRTTTSLTIDRWVRLIDRQM